MENFKNLTQFHKENVENDEEKRTFEIWSAH